jgi:hypothetical protein
MIEVTIAETIVVNGELDMTAHVRVKTALPAQDKRLPQILEQVATEAGQYFMRAYYRQAIEAADAELNLSLRAGKAGAGIQRMGKRRYTFKTCFGTVVVKRIRIRHKSDGSTEVPAARVWCLPRQRCITAGLKVATVELAGKQSYGSTVRQLVRETGEEKILSKTSVGNILHAGGRELTAANEARAAAVYVADESAKRVLGRAEQYLAEDFFERTWLGFEDLDEELSELDDEEKDEQLRALLHQIEWDAREQIAPTAPAQAEIASPQIAIMAQSLAAQSVAITPVTKGDLVIVMPDEVVVRSQEADKIWLIHYTAVVITADKTHYFSAPTSTQLFYQVSGLLATLKVHIDKQLLLISDGAAWIRRWYESIGIAPERKLSVLCWFHLKKHCWRLIREAITNKEDRITVRKALFDYLWRGQVTQARAYLTELLNNIEDGISRIAVSKTEALAALKEYLLMREQHIPDYLTRLRNKEWITNQKIEKFNDWSISTRCKKKNGMKWTPKGVGAIAALETGRRNNELEIWREHGQLPGWPRAA